LNAKKQAEGKMPAPKGDVPLSKVGRVDPNKNDPIVQRETDMSYYLFEIRQKQEQLRKKLADEE
jgi:hypothetical protein